ncbi:hypothetical protein Tco_1492276 [Tanacetum coccineum]
MRGNYSFNYACSLDRVRSGGLISMWDPNTFVKEDVWCDDAFIIVKRRWNNAIGDIIWDFMTHRPSIWEAFEGNTRDLTQFGKKRDKIATLHGDDQNVAHSSWRRRHNLL